MSTFALLLLVLLCLIVEAVFSMFEMACVSFHRVRLNYLLSKKVKRAKWIASYLEKPSMLFGTTLVVINTVMQIGSEAARRVFLSIDLSPEWAVLSQIFLVLIFAELAPLFAARRHPQYVALLFVPFVYIFSCLLYPLITSIDWISSKIYSLLGKSPSAPHFTREEVEKAFEERSLSEADVIGKIFSIQKKSLKEKLTPLENLPLYSMDALVKELIPTTSVFYIYEKEKKNIKGKVYLMDLLPASPDASLKDFMKPLFFVKEDLKIAELLRKFQTEKEKIAIVLDSKEEVLGAIDLEDLLEEIFFYKEAVIKTHVVEKTLSGEMQVQEFNKQFGAELKFEPNETLSDYLSRKLRHVPSLGEIYTEEPFEITVLEASLLGAKTVLVRTIF